MPAKKNSQAKARKTIRTTAVKPLQPTRHPAIKSALSRKRAAVGKPASSSGSPISALITELASLRASIDKRSPTLNHAGPMDEVDVIRRVLADIMENRMSAFLQRLACIRQSIPVQSQDVLDRMDALMQDMGAVAFEAERLEHLDPVIHSVGREVHDPQLPDGVIAGTLHPGFRTAQGQILSKALVSINRRT